jgi:UDP:flavonoid glycosyltransferase YjiC (YdhE family)
LTVLAARATLSAMKILFTTLREKSHFLGLLPFLEAFRRTGHDVAVAAPPDFGDQVTPTGATFLPFGHPGDEGLRPIWARMRGENREDLHRIAVAELFAGACARAALPRLIETVKEWKPAILIRESHEFAGLVAAEKMGVPHANVAICARGAEELSRSYATPAVDALLQSAGLPPDPTGDRMRSETSITLFPPSFDCAEGARQLSYRASRKEAAPLPDWWEGRTEPFVYLTLGTVTGGFEELRATYRTILDAVAGLPVRALLTIGKSLPIEMLGDVPGNVHVERFVPQDDVIPHAAAVLCHGGSGTVLGTLAAGVPLVVTPLFADQPHNAKRVTEIGVGVGLPARDVNVEALRAALSRVLGDPSFRDAAQDMAREIADLPPVERASDDLSDLVIRRGG